MNLLVAGLFALITACSSHTAMVQADRTPPNAQTVKDPRLWLNGEPVGSVSDPAQLQTQISKIMEMRENEGVYTEPAGKNLSDLRAPELKNGVYLFVSPNVSIGDFYNAYELLDEKCTVFMPRSNAINTASEEPRPNPLLLAVSVGTSDLDPSTIGHLVDFDVERKTSYDIYVDKVVDPGELWFERITGAIEILADGSYIVNERDVRWDSQGQYPPKQRTARVPLREEVSRLMQTGESGKNSLKIIASSLARYKDLDEILKLADEFKLRFAVRVNFVK